MATTGCLDEIAVGAWTSLLWWAKPRLGEGGLELVDEVDDVSAVWFRARGLIGVAFEGVV
jgi:hypothetical protein